MIRPIVIHPDARLRTACARVGSVDDGVRRLAADLLETMYAAPGRGLAAPQVGVLRRVFVVDAGWRDGTPSPRAFVDPEVVEASETLEAAAEVCLSIPDRPMLVARPASVTLCWTDLDGERREAAFGGAEARCVQHELDHLDGILVLDRGVPWAEPDEPSAAP